MDTLSFTCLPCHHQHSTHSWRPKRNTPPPLHCSPLALACPGLCIPPLMVEALPCALVVGLWHLNSLRAGTVLLISNSLQHPSTRPCVWQQHNKLQLCGMPFNSVDCSAAVSVIGQYVTSRPTLNCSSWALPFLGNNLYNQYFLPINIKSHRKKKKTQSV